MSRNQDKYRAKGPSPWGRTNRSRSNFGPPAHLKGKEIGLFYRDRYKKKMFKEAKKELIITLRIPPLIETKAYMNLQTIDKIAAKLNIPTPCLVKPKIPKLNAPFEKPKIIGIIDLTEPEIKEEIKEEHDTDISIPDMSIKEENADDIFKKPIIPKIKDEYSYSKPGTSSAPDYIPLVNQSTSDFESMKKEKPMTTLDFSFTNVEESSCYESGERVLSMRGGGDYKYGYEDIITGTFEEKLDECLRKGVGVRFTTPDVDEMNRILVSEYRNMLSKTGYQRLLEFREILPTFKKSQELLDVINNNQVVVISGETGCGKSTQVPQIILDDAICNNKGANVKILVTQPRRIAASSLAARVAQERAERLGNSVGYAVRLEKVDARSRGSIMFCTTGILLADLEVNQGLTNYSHIILDEVHERDSHVDLSMCMLKKVLKKRKDLKLILMSATIDAETLSQYFDQCPVMHIEGLAYPVKDIYLEEILQMTKYQLEEPKPCGKNQPKWKKHAKKDRNTPNNMEKDIIYKAEIAPWLESIKKNIDRQVYLTLQDSRIEAINIDLICELLINICKGDPGAILVFLPGIGEITKLMRTMTNSNKFHDSHYEIYPLHSKLPSLDQHKIFERPRAGVRKIIIATNIAETSITIDDIVYVVDCGKIKISGLNVKENVSTLGTEWASIANLRQRRGRAGRCQPGICYHLVTSYRAGKLAERILPELQRSNLLEPVLTIKRLRLGNAAEALTTVPSPPAETTVQWAVKHLQQCGALDDKETLTPLGWHLARLPVHPSAGKLLMLGALFGCLDRAASVAAVWGFKDPFQMVIGKDQEVDEKKRQFALGEPSDQIAISEAIIQWERLPRHHRRNFCYDNFLSNNTLELLSDMKQQLGDNLKQMGFLATGDVRAAWENRNDRNLSLFKAIVAASLYPNIATVKWLHTKFTKKNRQMKVKVHTPEDLRGISIHPSSVMSVPYRPGVNIPLCANPGANWLVYWLKQKSSELFLFEVTLVYTLPLLFFGELKVTVDDDGGSEECFMMISSIKVRCKRETADLLFQLRMLLDQVLAAKVMVSSNYATKHCDFEECVLNAVIELITAEDEQAEYLGDDDNSESDHSEAESYRSGSSRQWRH